MNALGPAHRHRRRPWRCGGSWPHLRTIHPPRCRPMRQSGERASTSDRGRGGAAHGSAVDRRRSSGSGIHRSLPGGGPSGLQSRVLRLSLGCPSYLDDGSPALSSRFRMNLRTRRRLHWVVPGAVLALTAGLSSLSRVIPAGADPSPVLPALTPAQLLDKVHNASITTLSGDIRLSSNLGLPDLSALGVGGGTLLDLLTGAHTIRMDRRARACAWRSTRRRPRTIDPQRHRSVVGTGDQRGDASDGFDGRLGRRDLIPRPAPSAPATCWRRSTRPRRSVCRRRLRRRRPVRTRAPRSDNSTIGDGVIPSTAARHSSGCAHGGAPTLPCRSPSSVSFDQPARIDVRFHASRGRRRTDERPGPPAPLGRFGHDVEGIWRAPDTVTPPAAAGTFTATQVSSQVKTVGTGWESVAIISGSASDDSSRRCSPAHPRSRWAARRPSRVDITRERSSSTTVASCAAMTPAAMAAVAGQ
jgi:hypothetical protein